MICDGNVFQVSTSLLSMLEKKNEVKEEEKKSTNNL